MSKFWDDQIFLPFGLPWWLFPFFLTSSQVSIYQRNVLGSHTGWHTKIVKKHTGWHTKIGKNMHGVQGYICCFFSSQFQSGFNLLKQCAGFPNKVKNIYELFSNMLSVRPFVHPSGKQTTLKQNHATTLHGTWWVIHFEILVGPPATVSVRPSENKIALQCWH